MRLGCLRKASKEEQNAGRETKERNDMGRLLQLRYHIERGNLKNVLQCIFIPSMVDIYTGY